MSAVRGGGADVTDRRILVAFKVTPDFEALPAAEWAAADGVELRYVRRVVNCFDESALELALRLRAVWGGHGVAAPLGAVSVAGPEAELTLRTLLALGYERAQRIAADADLDFAPQVTAALIAAYVRRAAPCDLLLTGCRAGPGDSGVVPFLVAAALGWPCLTQVVELTALADGRLGVTWAVDGGLMSGTLRLPCVLAVGNAVISRLRVPTLRDRLATQSSSVAVLTPEELGVNVSAELTRSTRALTGLEPLATTRGGEIVEGATAGEKAQVLYERFLRARLATAGGREVR